MEEAGATTAGTILRDYGLAALVMVAAIVAMGWFIHQLWKANKEMRAGPTPEAWKGIQEQLKALEDKVEKQAGERETLSTQHLDHLAKTRRHYEDMLKERDTVIQELHEKRFGGLMEVVKDMLVTAQASTEALKGVRETVGEMRDMIMRGGS